MALNWRTVPNYSAALYDFIQKLEAPQWDQRRQIHLVNGNPTIGIGFDLRAGGRTVQNQVLLGLGFTRAAVVMLLPPPVGDPNFAEYNYVAQLRTLMTAGGANVQSQLDAVMAARAVDPQLANIPGRRSDFRFTSDAEISGVFDQLLSTYRDKVLNKYTFLQGDTAYATSAESMVLFSLSWNGGSGLLGQKLGAALQTADRAEAWFQVRYGLNGGASRIAATGVGLQKRRFLESEVFSLYKDPSAPTQSEARDAAAMYQRNRDHIVAEEIYWSGRLDSQGRTALQGAVADYGNMLPHTPDGSIDALLENFLPARAKLIQTLNSDYGLQLNVGVVSPLAIYATSASNTVAAPLLNAQRDDGNPSLRDNLMLGDERSNQIVAGQGADILVGGGGADLLNGGEGNDLYIFRTNEGKDTITDSDGQGVIKIGGVGGLTLGTATGAIGLGNTWEVRSGNQVDLTLKFMGTTAADGTMSGTLIIDGLKLGGTGNAITINNWQGKLDQAGSLGITLQNNAALKVTSGNGLSLAALQSLFSGTSTPGPVDLNEGFAKTVTFAIAAVSDRVQTIKASIQSSVSDAIYAIVGDRIVPFSNGEIALTVQPGQNQVSFAIWDKGSITSDQAITLRATLVDGSGTSVAQSNDIAITLHNVDDPTTLPTPPQTTRTILGDLTPIDYNPPNKVYHYDDLGNVITNGSAQPGRADWLNDSAGNDLIDAGGGNDTIEAIYGGDNYVKAGDGDDSVDGGAGKDYVEAGAGDDIINTYAGDDRGLGGAGRDVLRGDVFGAAGGKDVLEGGGDADIVYGMAGDDRVYGDDYIANDDAITQGNTATAGTGQGDFLQGIDGNDTVVGSNRADLLGGGDGNDVLVGGAGDDMLQGDATFSASTRDWTMAVTFANNSYTFTVNGASRSEGTGDDRIYAGAGNDGVLAGAGNDLVDAGTGNDTVFGEAGDDQILGNNFLLLARRLRKRNICAFAI